MLLAAPVVSFPLCMQMSLLTVLLHCGVGLQPETLLASGDDMSFWAAELIGERALHDNHAAPWDVPTCMPWGQRSRGMAWESPWPVFSTSACAPWRCCCCCC